MQNKSELIAKKVRIEPIRSEKDDWKQALLASPKTLSGMQPNGLPKRA